MSDNTQLTTLGNLDPKLAATLCYVPIMSINLLAGLAFFFTEKENSFVRFHAAQGLMVVAAMTISGVLFGILWVVGGVGGAIIDSVLGTDGMISVLVSLAMSLLMLVYLAFVVLGPIGLAVMTFMEKNIRLPVLGGLAEKIAGLDAGWRDA